MIPPTLSGPVVVGYSFERNAWYLQSSITGMVVAYHREWSGIIYLLERWFGIKILNTTSHPVDLADEKART